MTTSVHCNPLFSSSFFRFFKTKKKSFLKLSAEIPQSCRACTAVFSDPFERMSLTQFLVRSKNTIFEKERENECDFLTEILEIFDFLSDAYCPLAFSSPLEISNSIIFFFFLIYLFSDSEIVVFYVFKIH